MKIDSNAEHPFSFIYVAFLCFMCYVLFYITCFIKKIFLMFIVNFTLVRNYLEAVGIWFYRGMIQQHGQITDVMSE